AENDHQVWLPGRGAGHRAKAFEVGPRTAGLHHLDRATGETKQHVPDRRLAGPVEHFIDLVRNDHLRHGIDQRHASSRLTVIGYAALGTRSSTSACGMRLSHSRSLLAQM